MLICLLRAVYHLFDIHTYDLCLDTQKTDALVRGKLECCRTSAWHHMWQLWGTVRTLGLRANSKVWTSPVFCFLHTMWEACRITTGHVCLIGGDAVWWDKKNNNKKENPVPLFRCGLACLSGTTSSMALHGFSTLFPQQPSTWPDFVWVCDDKDAVSVAWFSTVAR